jgi:hypothetical protein
VTAGTADAITDFQTGVDTISFGLAAGNGTTTTGNYVELGTIYTTYADAEMAAKSQFNQSDTTIYVVTQVNNDSYLFVDFIPTGNSEADSVVFLQGVTLNSIAASDIV